MDDELSRTQKAFIALTETMRPSFESIQREVDDYRKSRPTDSRDELANNWADRVCWLFASEGAASALPSVIPGLGTAAQVGIEAGAITADLLYMLRCMARISYGVGLIYDRDIEADFNQEFVKVLGVWCGVLQAAKVTTVHVGKKVAVSQFKRVPGEVFKRINRRVGTTVVTKYGTKRGGIAVGRLVPFGVGALVGGGFNLATMKGFKRSAIRYFRTTDQSFELD